MVHAMIHGNKHVHPDREGMHGLMGILRQEIALQQMTAACVDATTISTRITDEAYSTGVGALTRFQGAHPPTSTKRHRSMGLGLYYVRS